MLYIDFCKAPKGFWVGCAEYNNGRAFASGRTLDLLVANMKAMAYHTWKVSAYNVMLSSKQMEIGEFESKHAKFMSTKFRGKFWNQKVEEPKVKTTRKNTRKIKVVVDGILYNSLSEAETKLGFKPDTLGQALRHGQTMTKGHTIAYANDLPQFKKAEEKPCMVEKEETVVKENKIKYFYEKKDGMLCVYKKELVAQYEIEE